MSFKCEYCNYTTSNKGSYSKHLESKKHNDMVSKCKTVVIGEENTLENNSSNNSIVDNEKINDEIMKEISILKKENADIRENRKKDNESMKETFRELKKEMKELKKICTDYKKIKETLTEFKKEVKELKKEFVDFKKETDRRDTNRVEENYYNITIEPSQLEMLKHM